MSLKFNIGVETVEPEKLGIEKYSIHIDRSEMPYVMTIILRSDSTPIIIPKIVYTDPILELTLLDLAWSSVTPVPLPVKIWRRTLYILWKQLDNVMVEDYADLEKIVHDISIILQYGIHVLEKYSLHPCPCLNDVTLLSAMLINEKLPPNIEEYVKLVKEASQLYRTAVKALRGLEKIEIEYSNNIDNVEEH